MIDGQPLACYQPFIDTATGRIAGVEALAEYGFGAKPLFRVILAERGAEALGFALYYPDFSTLRGRPGVMLQDIYVREAARGLGLGRALLRDAVEARGEQARLQQVGMAEHGHDDQADVAEVTPDVTHQRQAVGKAAVGHRVIGDQDVTGSTLEALDQFTGAVGVGDYAVVLAERWAQGHFGAHQHHRMIIGQHDARGARHAMHPCSRGIASERPSFGRERLREVHAVTR